MGNYIGAAGTGTTSTVLKAFDKPKTPQNDQCKMCKNDPSKCKDLPFWTMPPLSGLPEWAVECTLFEYDWEKHYDLPYDGFAATTRYGTGWTDPRGVFGKTDP